MSQRHLVLEPLEDPIHPVSADLDGLAGDSPIGGWFWPVFGAVAGGIVVVIVIVP